MKQTFQLRPNETLIYDGDVTYFKSKLNVSATQAVVTSERIWVAGEPLAENSDIVTADEKKHGFGMKTMFTLRDGRSFGLAGADPARFKSAVAVLMGRGSVSDMPKAPALQTVKSGTAWLAAFGPVIALLLAAALGFKLHPSYGVIANIKAILAILALTYMFLKIDHLLLQKQGFDVKTLGLRRPSSLPLYLFRRAKVFGKSKAGAVIWCICFALVVLVALVGLAH